MQTWSHGLLLAFAAVGCSAGPDRILAPALVPALSAEEFPTAEGADRNGNGLVCRKNPPSGPKKFPVVYTDDSGDESQPCPPGFGLTGVAG